MGNLGFQELLLIGIIGMATCIIPFIFYLITLQDALKAVSPENRRMAPANVWLLFIPLFNAIWIFFVVDAIASSFKQEYDKYGIFSEGKPTYGIGLAMAIIQICSVVIPFAGLAWFVCWIIYWVKVNECKNEIINIHQNTNLPDREKSIFL
jgi:hypothetical protein